MKLHFPEAKSKREARVRVLLGIVGISYAVVIWTWTMANFIWEGSLVYILAAIITTLSFIVIYVCSLSILDGLRSLKKGLP